MISERTQQYFSKNPKLDAIYEKVKDKHIQKSHDVSHIERVMENCIEIGRKENADIEILLLSALLHDLGRIRGGVKEEHSKISSEYARKILKEDCSVEIIDRVGKCIESHSSLSRKEPKTIEEKVFFDADKLDSYGFIGVGRFFTLAGEKGWDLEKAMKEALKKIRGIGKTRGFYTKTARKIGKRKASRAFAFYYTLAKELNREDYESELKELFRNNVGKVRGKLSLKLMNMLY